MCRDRNPQNCASVLHLIVSVRIFPENCTFIVFGLLSFLLPIKHVYIRTFIFVHVSRRIIEFAPVSVVNAYGGVEVCLMATLLALNGGQWSTSCTRLLIHSFREEILPVAFE